MSASDRANRSTDGGRFGFIAASLYDDCVFGVIFILLLAVPIIELYIIVQVAGGIGTLETILLLIFVSVVGAWLVRREGLGVLGRLQGQLGQGRVPANEIVDGLLILVAGALMLTPGFLTDALGLLLLIPPTRIIVRKLLIRRFRGRVHIGGGALGGQGFQARWGNVYDVSDLGGTGGPPGTGEDGPKSDPPPPIELGPDRE